MVGYANYERRVLRIDARIGGRNTRDLWLRKIGREHGVNSYRAAEPTAVRTGRWNFMVHPRFIINLISPSAAHRANTV